MAGAFLGASDSDGATALHLAALAGHVDCVQALVRLGAPLRARDKKGILPSDIAANAAAREGRTAMLAALGVSEEMASSPKPERL